MRYVITHENDQIHCVNDWVMRVGDTMIGMKTISKDDTHWDVTAGQSPQIPFRHLGTPPPLHLKTINLRIDTNRRQCVKSQLLARWACLLISSTMIRISIENVETIGSDTVANECLPP